MKIAKPLNLFTMWVLIINTNFANAEPRHFEMQKYPKKEFIYFEKKDCFTQDLNLRPKSFYSVIFWPTIRPSWQNIENVNEFIICMI